MWQDAVSFGMSIASLIASGIALGLVARVERKAVAKARRRAATDRRREMSEIDIRVSLLEEIQLRGVGPRLAEAEADEAREAV